jgi:hypothetical protein
VDPKGNNGPFPVSQKTVLAWVEEGILKALLPSKRSLRFTDETVDLLHQATDSDRFATRVIGEGK